MECDPDGRCGAQVVYGHERVGEAGVASLHRGVRRRVSSAGVGHGLGCGGGCEGKSLLDVAGLLLVFFLITLFNLSLVFLYACLEV